MIDIRYLIEALEMVDSEKETIAIAKGKYQKKAFTLRRNGNKGNGRNRSRK